MIRDACFFITCFSCSLAHGTTPNLLVYDYCQHRVNEINRDLMMCPLSYEQGQADAFKEIILLLEYQPLFRDIFLDRDF